MIQERDTDNDARCFELFGHLTICERWFQPSTGVVVRDNIRRMVRRALRKYGYPPDKQEKATLTVLEQAEQIAKDWVG